MVASETKQTERLLLIKAVIFDWGRTLYDGEAGALFPDAAAVVEYLARTYTLAIVALITQGDYETGARDRRAILRDAGLAPYFASTLFAREDKDRLYARALEQLGRRACEVAIVDDRVQRGIRWGNRHGATTVWLRRGKFRDEPPTADTGQPTHIVSALTDLYKVL